MVELRNILITKPRQMARGSKQDGRVIRYSSVSTGSNVNTPLLSVIIYVFNFNSKLRSLTLDFNRKLVSECNNTSSCRSDTSRTTTTRAEGFMVKTDWINKTRMFIVKSNSFKILKMESPYSDRCFNYPDIGLRDRNDAIATCESNRTHVSC